MNWEVAAQMSGVAAIIGGAIVYVMTNVVLNPLKDAIKQLGKTVDKFSEQLARADERWHNQQIEMVRLDEKVEALHSRLDRVERKMGRDNHDERHEHR